MLESIPALSPTGKAENSINDQCHPPHKELRREDTSWRDKVYHSYQNFRAPMSVPPAQNPLKPPDRFNHNDCKSLFPPPKDYTNVNHGSFTPYARTGKTKQPARQQQKHSKKGTFYTYVQVSTQPPSPKYVSK